MDIEKAGMISPKLNRLRVRDVPAIGVLMAGEGVEVDEESFADAFLLESVDWGGVSFGSYGSTMMLHLVLSSGISEMVEGAVRELDYYGGSVFLAEKIIDMNTKWSVDLFREAFGHPGVSVFVSMTSGWETLLIMPRKPRVQFNVVLTGGDPPDIVRGGVTTTVRRNMDFRTLVMMSMASCDPDGVEVSSRVSMDLGGAVPFYFPVAAGHSLPDGLLVEGVLGECPRIDLNKFIQHKLHQRTL